MIELLQSRPNRNGNIKKLKINHETKTFEYGYFISGYGDFEIITTQERLGEYKRTLKELGYREVY